VLFAAGPAEYETAIARALREDGEEKRRRRRSIARENSWTRRAGQLEEWIGSALDAKGC
jgi:hypothetical protein